MKFAEMLLKIQDHDFSVSVDEDDNTVTFSKYSPAGQDFSFSVDINDDLEEFAQSVWSFYEDYDVSYEAYIWLDNTGHGRNGAPYDMRDVYDDMAACRQYINDIYDIIRECI